MTINQISSNDQELVFSAADDQGNHDIILYNFSTKNFTNLTKTADRSEYSPSITDCKQYIAAVVVEPGGCSAALALSYQSRGARTTL